MLLLHMLWLLCVATVLNAVRAYGNGTKVATTVDLGYAVYRGSEVDEGYKQWLGIRFAAPPLGDLRWRAPADPVANSTLQEASNYPPVCLSTKGIFRNETQDEDCLFLNVFIPANITTETRLPVWVYISGGGYSAITDPNVNGMEVLRRSGGSAIFVSFSYRVGAFGFLASEELRQNGDLNVGFLDQRKVLEWVQKYIHNFGGDPDHVVIHGASAGAGSVALHLTAYGGRNDKLFIGAIGESVYFPTQRKINDYRFQYTNFVNKAGCSNATDTLKCLRSKDVASLRAANSAAIPFPGATDVPFFPYAPCIDGNIIEDYPNKLFIDNKYVRVPMLIGDDTDEGTYFANNASTPLEVSAFIHDQFPNLSTTNLSEINDLYPNTKKFPLHAPYFSSAVAAYGEATFTCPGLLISHSASLQSPTVPVWNYRYNVQDSRNLATGLGVPHVFELDAIFGRFRSDTNSSYHTYNAPIVPMVQDYWLNFVRFLDPNGEQLSCRWDYFNETGSSSRLLIQTNATMMETVPKDHWERCAFWSDVTEFTQS